MKEYVNDPYSYPCSLKRLKFLFKQSSTAAKAVLSDVTTRQQVANKNTNALAKLYHSKSNCINSLPQLNYTDDLNSSDVLDKVVGCLPIGLTMNRLWIYAKKALNQIFVILRDG